MLSTHRESSNPSIQVKTLTKQTLNVKRELWAAERFHSQSFDLPVRGTGPGLHTALEFYKALYWLSRYSSSSSLFLPFSPLLPPSFLHPPWCYLLVRGRPWKMSTLTYQETKTSHYQNPYLSFKIWHVRHSEFLIFYFLGCCSFSDGTYYFFYWRLRSLVHSWNFQP